MDLVASVGTRYELREARRFSEVWEAAASLRLRDADGAVLADYYKHGRLLDCGTAVAAENSAADGWLADTLGGKRSVLIVGNNEAAARLNGYLRSELVRLGRVEGEGVELGRDGNHAGVGDVVQARSNGWQLAGHDGNRRGPINRERLHVLEVREDGSLRVAASDRGRGEAMTLPGDYVRNHLTLGYASTAHGAQGRTVDTSHIVVAPGTGAAALYVGMSRGRHTNTAHIATVSVPEDARPGATHSAMRRNAVAILTNVLEAADPQRGVLAEAAASAAEAASVRTAVELFADAVDLATAGRTANWLDQLVDESYLSEHQRSALLAEQGASTLDRLLRRVELAGHDPEDVFRTAIGERNLFDARQLTNVLHHRIVSAVDLDPSGDTFLSRLPAIDDPQWQQYLRTLATLADARVGEQAEHTAEQSPPWATAALGPVPLDKDERAEWLRRAGAVLAYRELSGHDDPDVALGQPPKPGQPESVACWRAAWRALGRDEASREEAEMSDGQLRVRVRAWEREQAWAPRYVANELAATSQAAAEHRAGAVLQRAEAEFATDPIDVARLTEQATENAALAEILEQRGAQLATADEARAIWYAHTAATRSAGERATAELANRPAHDEPSVTAEQWLAAHAVAQAAEDPHREIGDVLDFADVREQRRRDLAALDNATDVAADSHAQTTVVAAPGEDMLRVPTADETAATLTRARAALAEIAQRQVLEQARLAEEVRARQLAHWSNDAPTIAEPVLAAERP
jgi:hypothetical protein